MCVRLITSGAVGPDSAGPRTTTTSLVLVAGVGAQVKVCRLQSPCLEASSMNDRRRQAMFSLSWLKTAWRPSDSARARYPRAFLPSPQPLLDGAGRNHPNPATSVTCSWTTPPLYESTLLLRKAPCAGPALSHKTCQAPSPQGSFQS